MTKTIWATPCSHCPLSHSHCLTLTLTSWLQLHDCGRSAASCIRDCAAGCRDHQRLCCGCQSPLCIGRAPDLWRHWHPRDGAGFSCTGIFTTSLACLMVRSLLAHAEIMLCQGPPYVAACTGQGGRVRATSKSCQHCRSHKCTPRQICNVGMPHASAMNHQSYLDVHPFGNRLASDLAESNEVPVDLVALGYVPQ